MPSSTSNSSVATRLPSFSIKRLWIVTAIGFVLLTGGLECYLHACGVKPTVADSEVLWSIHRHRLEAEDTSNMIVILGSSRAQLGINPENVKQAVPHSAVTMLAIDGQQGYEVLYDIAENSSFAGTIVFECFPTKKTRTGRVMEYIQKHRDMSDGYGAQYNASANCLISTWLSAHLRVATTKNRLCEVLFRMARNREEKSYLRTLPSRYRPADYRGMPEAWLKTHRNNRIERDGKNREFRNIHLDQWRTIVLRIRQAVETIESRGGRVILVRMPVTDDSWEIKSHAAPREVYWDCFSAEGMKTIHFMDYPQLQFDCPDTSHLNYDDAILFTKALMTLLGQKGWLPPTRSNDKMH